MLPWVKDAHLDHHGLRMKSLSTTNIGMTNTKFQWGLQMADKGLDFA